MIITPEEAAAIFEDETFTDARYSLYLGAADAFVKRYTGRPFERGTYTEIVEASGSTNVYVAEENITAIVSVFADERGEFGPETQITDLGLVHAEGNRIVFESGYWPEGRAVVKITYTGGYWPASDPDPTHVPKMPDDLRLAVAQIALANKMKMKAAVLGTDVQSESFTGYSYSKSQPTQRNTSGYSDAIMDVLDAYRRY